MNCWLSVHLYVCAVCVSACENVCLDNEHMYEFYIYLDLIFIQN